MLNKILRVLLYATVFLIPIFFLPMSFEVLEFNKLYLLFVMAGLSLIVWLLKMIIKDKEFKICHSIVDYAVLAFVLISAISFGFSIDKISGLLGYYGRFGNGLISIISFAIFYFLIANNLKSRNLKPENENVKTKDKKSEGVITVSGIIKTLLSSGFVAIFFAYFGLFLIWAKIAVIGEGFRAVVDNIALRVSPIASNIEGLAMFLVVTSLLAVFIILGGLKWVGDGDGEKKGKEKKWDIIAGIYLFLAIILLVIADFTPAWIILIVGLVLLAGLILKRRILKNDVHKLILPIGIIILSLMFLLLNFRGLAESFSGFVLNSSSGFIPERSLTQSESWGVASRSATANFKNAIIGTGPGTYYYDYAKYKPVEMNSGILWAIGFDRAGNNASEILATMGFLGFIAFLTMLGAFFLINILSKSHGLDLKQSKNDHASSFFMILFAVMILTQFMHYQTIALGFLFWLFLGIGVGWQNVKAGERAEVGVVKRIKFKLRDYVEMALLLETVVIILFLSFVTICFFGTKFYLADMKYVQALNTPELQDKADILQKAFELNPYQPRYQIVLSKIYLAKTQEELTKLGEGDDQTAMLNNLRLARLFGENAAAIGFMQTNTWQNLAELYQGIAGMAEDREQFINLSIAALNTQAELEPRNPRIYNDIGSLYLLLKNKDKAREMFNKSVEQKRDFVSANINLALMLEEEKNIDEAMSKLEWLLSANPNEQSILFHLGRLYYNNEEIERAITQFREAISLDPYYSNARYALGLAYEKQGKIQQAIDELEIVAQLNPNNQEIANK
ncbi:tetratricopeptide repeat protein, partial [Patescibacteria group bacterium]|nr:tetratricopeptide repeat protein [Patescibacteria group bacterium]